MICAFCGKNESAGALHICSGCEESWEKLAYENDPELVGLESWAKNPEWVQKQLDRGIPPMELAIMGFFHGVQLTFEEDLAGE